MTEEKLDEFIQVVVKPEEKKLIMKFAKGENRNISNFMRTAALERIKKIVEDKKSLENLKPEPTHLTEEMIEEREKKEE
ncbi:hypothetical protein CMI37_32525 [Candidatus Pacearchaeota archaeon]|nr:hypothetical protein [Candidatus Pacearchaeota archaeon]|tara:strand:- start:22784 stop:23020 length:237 start_codon:yes stop_codon:yes gene_type:complete